MRSNKDRKLNLGTAFRLTIMNQFVKKNLDVKIHKLCNLANTEEIQCMGEMNTTFSDGKSQFKPDIFKRIRTETDNKKLTNNLQKTHNFQPTCK